MKKTLIQLSVLLIFNLNYAQDKTEKFNLILPTYMIEGSLYNQVTVLDSRFDTTNIGIVQLGMFNNKARVVCEIPLEKQIDSILKYTIKSPSKNGKLLLQIRYFNISELTKSMSELGYLRFRANLYSEIDNKFYKLDFLDTFIEYRGGMSDVTNAILEISSFTLVDFITKNLSLEPKIQTPYSLFELKNIDSFEKKLIPIYNTSSFKDGLYSNYNSFYNQIPDLSMGKIKMKDTLIKAVFKTNNEEKYNYKEIYALVLDGKPYVSTKFGFYPLFKIGNELIYTGKAKTSANSGDMIAMGLMFGLIGSAILADNSSSTFEMKLDHLDGSSIRIKEVNINKSYSDY